MAALGRRGMRAPTGRAGAVATPACARSRGMPGRSVSRSARAKEARRNRGRRRPRSSNRTRTARAALRRRWRWSCSTRTTRRRRRATTSARKRGASSTGRASSRHDAHGRRRDTLEQFPTREVHRRSRRRAGPHEGERARRDARRAPAPVRARERGGVSAGREPEPATVRVRLSSSSPARRDLGVQRLLGRHAGDPAWSDEVRAYYLERPADPRFAELAQQIIEERLQGPMRDDPFARALAIKLWLDHELIYSTRHRHAGVGRSDGGLPLRRQTGYCMHFAHAAVFLWRAAGMPSRIGAGYIGPEENRRGGSSILIGAPTPTRGRSSTSTGTAGSCSTSRRSGTSIRRASRSTTTCSGLLGEMARDKPPEPEDERSRRSSRRPARSGAPSRSWCSRCCSSRCSCSTGEDRGGGSRRRSRGPATLARRRVPQGARQARRGGLVRASSARRARSSRGAWAAARPRSTGSRDAHLAAKLGAPGRTTRSCWRDPEHRSRRGSEALARMRARAAEGTRWWRRMLGLLHPASFLDSR